MTKAEILASLNPEQGKAASAVTGPVLVLAGAGTGKTRVITYRIAYMLASGIPGENILGMTFTNKAAREMRERLDQLVGRESAEDVTLGTFHSFCGRVLRKEISKLGYLPSYTIADESDQQGIFKQACGKLGCNYDGFPSTEAFGMISKWKNKLIMPQEAVNNALTPFEDQAAQIYKEYQSILEEQNQIDFDDMLLLVWKIFREHPDVLALYRDRYRFLLVDEYQDTNYAQYTILRMLGGEKPNLCVVGDDDQSIYSWRGADVGNILDFPEHFPGATVVKLEQNYRSKGSILNAANQVISSGGGKRHAKKLWSALGTGDIPITTALGSGEEEADFICQMIRQMMQEDPALKYSDFAILYRSNQLSRQLEQTFRTGGLPYRMFGGQPFWQRREIKDAIAYLRLVVNPHEDQSLLRILSTPPRGLGGKVVDMLKEYREKNCRPMFFALGDPDFTAGLSSAAKKSCEMLRRAFDDGRKNFAAPGNLASGIAAYLESVGYSGGLQRIYKDIDDARQRRENLDEFISAISQYENRNGNQVTLQDFLDTCMLQEEKEKEDDSQLDAVVFSTVHAAKGLEFPIVFVIAMEDGIFPHERSVEEGSLDEEKRLFYVAITRAKEKLFLLRSVRRMHRGSSRPARISPFLRLLGNTVDSKLPDDLIKTASDDDVLAAFAAIYDSLKQK